MKTKTETGCTVEVRCSATRVGVVVLRVKDANGCVKEYPIDHGTAIKVAGMLLSRALKVQPKVFR